MNFEEMAEDLHLAVDNLSCAVERLTTANPAPFSSARAERIAEMLTSTFWKCLPHFAEGRAHNPIHHHTQVLDNMVRIGLGEQPGYPEFRNATLLALVHDMGNAASQRPKVKTNEVRAALNSSSADGERAARKALAFRLEHMDKGPDIARTVLSSLGADGPADVDLHLIGRAITVHDYPSIEKVLQDLRNGSGITLGYGPGDFLLPFANTPFGRLITWLREADRLWMLSEQGVLKDLSDAGADPSPGNIRKKLQENARKHEDEFSLYARAEKGDGFQSETLYRTPTGFALFQHCQRHILNKFSD